MTVNLSYHEGGNARGQHSRNGSDGGTPLTTDKKRNRQAGAEKLTEPRVLEKAKELKALLDGRELSAEEVAVTRVMPRTEPLRLTENTARREMFSAFLSRGKPLDPIIVRRVGDGADKLEVVDGEDRLDGARRAQQLTIRVIIVDCTAGVGFALAGLLNTRHGTPLNEAEKLAFAIALLKGNPELRRIPDRELERAYNLQISDSTFLRAKQAIRKRKKKIPAKVDAKTTDEPKPAPEPATADEVPKPTQPLNTIATSTRSSREKLEPASVVMSEEELKHVARALYRATANYATRLSMLRTNVYLHVCQILGEEV